MTMVVIRMGVIGRDPGRLVGQRQEGIMLGTDEAPAALLVGEQGDEKPGEQQAEKEGERDDGHGVDLSGGQTRVRLRGGR